MCELNVPALHMTYPQVIVRTKSIISYRDNGGWPGRSRLNLLTAGTERAYHFNSFCQSTETRGAPPISVNLAIGVASAATSGFRQLCDDRFPIAEDVGQVVGWQNGVTQFSQHEAGFPPAATAQI